MSYVIHAVLRNIMSYMIHAVLSNIMLYNMIHAVLCNIMLYNMAASHQVHQYRVAMTAKDCSIMITIATCGEEDG